MTGSSTTMANLIAALNETSPSEGPDSEIMISVKNGLINILKEWSDTKTGFHLNLENKDMFRLLVPQLGNKDKLVRTQVTNFLSACLKNSPQNPPPPKIFDAAMLVEIMNVTTASMLTELEKTEDVGIMQQWSLLVKLLGTHLHYGAGMINQVLTVVKRAFTLENEIVNEAAYRSWIVVMDSFSMSERILNSAKRIGLLVIPLKANNAKSESVARVKFEAWWHLIALLGVNCKTHFNIVVLPFFRSFYGSRLYNAGAPTPVDSPDTPISPVKKHSGMGVMCLDAMVQLFASRPLDASLPRPQLKTTLESNVITPQLMRDNANRILFAVQEATTIVKSVNRSEIMRLEVIWLEVGKLFRSMAERCQSDDCSEVEVSKTLEAVYWYVMGIKEIVVHCRRQEKLHKLLLNILETASRLPNKSLNITYRPKNDSDAISSQKPVVHLLQVVLHQELLALATDEPQYLEMVHRLLDGAIKSPNGHVILPFVHARMEEVVQSVGGSRLEGLVLVWQTIAEFTANLENLEVGGSFEPVLNLLSFPVTHFSEKGSDSKVWKVWTSLYQAAVAAGEVSVTKDTSDICHQMTGLLVAVAKSQETKAGIMSPGTEGGVTLPTGQLAAQARCANIMVNNVDLSTLARLIKSRDPLPNFAPRVGSGSAGPLGNLTTLVIHINSLFNYINTTSSWSYNRGNSVGSALKSVLSSYQHLLTSINQQELIQPLLKIVTPTIAKMLNDKFLKTMSKHLPNLNEEVEKVFIPTVVLIQARYSGNYTKEFLADLEAFFIAAFGCGKKSIKTKTSEMWQVTFGLLPKSDVPEALVPVLKRSANQSLRAQWSQEEVVSFPSSNDSGSQPLVITAEPAIANAINRKVSPKKSPPPPDSAPGPEAPSEMKPPTNKPQIKKKSPRPLEDDSSQDFVPIKSSVPKKRVLTDHQKDVLTSRHDDIPALYSELSRDDSVIHLPSQFMSQPSMEESLPSTDLGDKLKEGSDKGGNDKTKENETDTKENKTDANAKNQEKENGENVNGAVEEGSHSLLSIEKKAAMKELKNKRFELRLEETPKADKIAKKVPKRLLRVKRKAEGLPGRGEKRTKLDLTEEIKETNGEGKTKEEIADALFKPSEDNVVEIAAVIQSDPESVQIVSPDPKATPETVTLQSSDENNDDNNKVLGKDLSKVNVKVQKLSPVLTKKHMDHDISTSAPIKKKLFEELPVQSKDDSSATSSEDDIIQSSQPLEVELEQSRTKRGRRSLAKLEMEVKKIANGKIIIGNKELNSNSNEVEKSNPFGETAVHAAAKNGDVVRVEEQLMAGADPNLTDNARWSPLREVSISDKENSVAIMNLLIEHGSTVDCQNREEAVESAKDNVTYEKQVDVLINTGANPDLKTGNGKNALELAKGKETLVNLLNKEKTNEMNVTPIRTSSREKKRSVRLANFVDMNRDESGKFKAISDDLNNDGIEKSGSVNSNEGEQGDTVNDSTDISEMNESEENPVQIDENPNSLVKQPSNADFSSENNNAAELLEASENSLVELKIVSKEVCGGAASPDANKENVSTNSDDDKVNSGKAPFASQNGLASSSAEDKREKVNPFTAVIEKHKAETKKRPSLGSAGTSRGAMLLSLSRRTSLDSSTRQSPAALGLLDPLASPSSAFSSPKTDVSKSMPWVKYKPSPSSASPSASILKRRGLDSEESPNCEDSPISTKTPRLDTSLNERRVHFNEDPVSDSVEIPRAPDGKHTRKKLQLSGYDQEMFIENKGQAEAEMESQPSQGLYSDSPPVDLAINSIYPELVNSKEPIAIVVPHLATGNWAKILATDLKNNGIAQVGQLAIMDPCQIRTLRGVKPNKVDSVRNTLKTLHNKLLKEGKMVHEKKEKAKAPVEEVTTPEDEEKIKEDLFLRPSPSPTDLGYSPLDAIPSSPDRNDIDMELNFEVKKESPLKSFPDISPSQMSPPHSPSKDTESLSVSPSKVSPLHSPKSSPPPSPSKASPSYSPTKSSPPPSPSKASPTNSPTNVSLPPSPDLQRMTRFLESVGETGEDISPELGDDLFVTPDATDENVAPGDREVGFSMSKLKGLEELQLCDDQLDEMSSDELLKGMENAKEIRVKLMQQIQQMHMKMLKISQYEEKLFNKLKTKIQ